MKPDYIKNEGEVLDEFIEYLRNHEEYVLRAAEQRWGVGMVELLVSVLAKSAQAPDEAYVSKQNIEQLARSMQQ